MNFTVAVAFLSVAIPAFFTPGPNNLMLMTSSARFGLGRTVPHALGVVIGFPVMVFLVGLGLGEVFVRFPVLETVMRYAAVAYFLWMAWHLLGLEIGQAGGVARPMRFHEAALFQWVNPKAWAMATSLVVLMVADAPNRTLALILLTLGCFSLSPLSSLLWMVFGHQVEAFLRRTGAERYLGVLLAGLMVLAVLLFLL